MKFVILFLTYTVYNLYLVSTSHGKPLVTIIFYIFFKKKDTRILLS